MIFFILFFVVFDCLSIYLFYSVFAVVFFNMFKKKTKVTPNPFFLWNTKCQNCSFPLNQNT